MRRVLRPLVALASGLALLTLTATPTAATTGTVTGGTLSINLTPPLVTTLYTCGGASSASVVVTADSATSASGTWGFTLVVPFDLFSGHYVLQGTYTSATPLVTIDKVAGTFAVAPFTLTGATIRPTASSGSCTPTSMTSVCGALVLTFSSGLTGSWTGTVSLPNLTGTATLGGSGTFFAACTAPWSAFNGKTATFTAMTIAF